MMGSSYKYLFPAIVPVIAAIFLTIIYRCPPLPDPASGVVALTGLISWVTATYTCNSGFELDLASGNETRTCQLDGTWTGSVPLCVAVAVIISGSGEGQYAGEDYTLTCVVSGGGSTRTPFSYRWLKNGAVQSGETSSTLSFTPLRQTSPSSDGEYTCEAMRNGRSFSSERFTLSVQGDSCSSLKPCSPTAAGLRDASPSSQKQPAETLANPQAIHNDDEDLLLGSGLTALYRYWKPAISDHFYTSNIAEIGTSTKGQVGRHGYTSEGTQCLLYTTQVQEAVPLFRYWNGHNDHFYTTNADEIGTTTPGAIGNHGYQSEGIAGYCFVHEKSGTIPLYQYWKSSVADHFYTTNAAEIGTTTPGHAGKYGYQSEGVACYVIPYSG